MTEKALLQYLKDLENHRTALQAQQAMLDTVDRSLAQLTPSDRLIADRMLLHPAKNNGKLLTQMLGMESSALYRHRKRILKTLQSALYTPNK